MPITVEQAKEAAETGRKGAMGCGAVVLVIASCFLISAIVSGQWLNAIAPLLFAGISGGAVVWGLAPAIRAWKITPPDISLSRDAVRLGESFDFRYYQTFKSRLNVDFAKVEFVMREMAIYRRGTDTYTETHEIPVFMHEIPGGTYSASDALDLSHRFTVPPDAMHTFIAGNNRIEWLIRVTVSIAKWPDVNETYPVRVLPERFLAASTEDR